MKLLGPVRPSPVAELLPFKPPLKCITVEFMRHVVANVYLSGTNVVKERYYGVFQEIQKFQSIDCAKSKTSLVFKIAFSCGRRVTLGLKLIPMYTV